MANLPFTDKVMETLLKKFDVRNPNDGTALTIEGFTRFFNMNDMDKRLTLLSIVGMCENNNYLKQGTKKKLIKAMKDYDG